MSTFLVFLLVFDHLSPPEPMPVEFVRESICSVVSLIIAVLSATLACLVALYDSERAVSGYWYLAGSYVREQ